MLDGVKPAFCCSAFCCSALCSGVHVFKTALLAKKILRRVNLSGKTIFFAHIAEGR